MLSVIGCVQENFVQAQSIGCYSASGQACYGGQQNDPAAINRLLSYLNDTAADTAAQQGLWMAQAHWQYDAGQFSALESANSTLLLDTELAAVNPRVAALVPALPALNLLELNDVCYAGQALVDAVRARNRQPPLQLPVTPLRPTPAPARNVTPGPPTTSPGAAAAPTCCQGAYSAPFALGAAACPPPPTGILAAGASANVNAECAAGAACQAFSCSGALGTIYGAVCASPSVDWLAQVPRAERGVPGGAGWAVWAGVGASGRAGFSHALGHSDTYIRVTLAAASLPHGAVAHRRRRPSALCRPSDPGHRPGRWRIRRAAAGMSQVQALLARAAGDGAARASRASETRRCRRRR